MRPTCSEAGLLGHLFVSSDASDRTGTYCLNIISLVATSSGTGRPSILAILALTLWSISGRSDENIVYKSDSRLISTRKCDSPDPAWTTWLQTRSSPSVNPHHPTFSYYNASQSFICVSPTCPGLVPNNSQGRPERESWQHTITSSLLPLHGSRHTGRRGMYPVPLLE